MEKKKVCIVTGSRSEYGILKLIIEKIEASKKLDLLLFVTGMHLLKRYGNTIDIIRKNGIIIDKIIPMYEENEFNREKLGNAVGKAIINFTKAFIEFNPDLLLVLGDRYEALAAVIAASTISLPIAHIHGGDISGSIDDSIRHAITKFSHVHFPSTLKSKKRILLLGEDESRVFVFGSPAIDAIYSYILLNKEDICKKFEFDINKKLILCVQHPNTFESQHAGEQMKLTLQILKDLNLNTVIIYPNNDPGSELIINEIEKNRDISYFKIFKNLERIDYLSLLKNADLLIGNSSSGKIESPIFKLPVVNIGDRDKDRESAENVIDVPHEYNKIKNAVLKGLSDNFKAFCRSVKNPYGDGNASNQIVKTLEDLQITKEFVTKKLKFKV